MGFKWQQDVITWMVYPTITEICEWITIKIGWRWFQHVATHFSNMNIKMSKNVGLPFLTYSKTCRKRSPFYTSPLYFSQPNISPFSFPIPGLPPEQSPLKNMASTIVVGGLSHPDLRVVGKNYPKWWLNRTVCNKNKQACQLKCILFRRRMYRIYMQRL